MSDAHYGIRLAADRSGLSQDILRAWERRYQAVRPVRTATARRMYGESEVHRLQILRRLTEAGHQIGDIARLSDARLAALLKAEPESAVEISRESAISGGKIAPSSGISHPRPRDRLKTCLAAVKALDAAALEEVFGAALVELGRLGLLTRFITPVAHEIGQRWRAGELTAAHEHFATAAIKAFLNRLPGRPTAVSSGPLIVVATPVGEPHELGALMAHLVAQEIGWRSVYLGCNLPAAEIAGAVRQKEACAVALSVVYPADESMLGMELLSLRKHLPRPVEIIVGGRAAKICGPTLRQTGARRVSSLEAFGEMLDTLRSQLRTRKRTGAEPA